MAISLVRECKQIRIGGTAAQVLLARSEVISIDLEIGMRKAVIF